jgi:hypothetical protein
MRDKWRRILMRQFMEDMTMAQLGNTKEWETKMLDNEYREESIRVGQAINLAFGIWEVTSPANQKDPTYSDILALVDGVTYPIITKVQAEYRKNWLEAREKAKPIPMDDATPKDMDTKPEIKQDFQGVKIIL